MDYENLAGYCKTERQQEVLRGVLEYGSISGYSTAAGIPRSTVRSVINCIKLYAANGENGLPESIPDGYKLKGTSTYYGPDGQIKGQWVKTDEDKARKEELLREWVADFGKAIENYKPFKRVKSPAKVDDSLLSIYPMGDPHIGMYAWSGETGADFDCDIAEKNLKEAMGYLVSKMPDSETAVILNLGDFFHTDNSANTTTKGTRVDVDTRFSRVLRVGIELMIEIVNLALTKHKKVIVRNNRGNHDKETSQVLSIVLMYAFKNNPCVTVYPPEKEFFCHTFGKNMIFSAHGDMLKPRQAAQYMAAAFPKEWGSTEFRYAEFGHFHHEDRKEDGGVVVEIYNTLASSDAWHHNSGYLSNRNMKAKVLHRDYGEVERYTYSIPRFL